MTSFIPDGILLEKLRDGCVESFNSLYDKYWKTVYLTAFRKLGNADQAKDITQDIFANLWIRRADQSIENLPAYLQISVRNRVLNLFERQRRFIPIENLTGLIQARQGAPSDEMTLQREFMIAYQAFVNSLPAQRKKIYHLFYDQGRSTGEIAGEMKLSRKTVQNQLRAAVSFLRTQLSQFFATIIICNLADRL